MGIQGATFSQEFYSDQKRMPPKWGANHRKRGMKQGKHLPGQARFGKGGLGYKKNKPGRRNKKAGESSTKEMREKRELGYREGDRKEPRSWEEP